MVVAADIDDVDDEDDDDDDDVVVPDMSLFGSSLIVNVEPFDGDKDAADVVIGHIITGFAMHSCHTRSGIVVVDGIGLCIVAEWPRSFMDFSDIGTGGTVLHFFSKFSSSKSVTNTYLDG